MRRIFLCSACPAVQTDDDARELSTGDDCPNCGDEGEITEYVAVTLADIEGRSGDYVLSLIQAGFVDG